LIKQKTQVINELKGMLYSSFPEIQRYCKNGVPIWVLTILKQYPTAEKLAKAKVEKLEKILLSSGKPGRKSAMIF
jgi:hypothetical protein